MLVLSRCVESTFKMYYHIIVSCVVEHNYSLRSVLFDVSDSSM
jgi:hypothetical protein